MRSRNHTAYASPLRAVLVFCGGSMGWCIQARNRWLFPQLALPPMKGEDYLDSALRLSVFSIWMIDGGQCLRNVFSIDVFSIWWSVRGHFHDMSSQSMSSRSEWSVWGRVCDTYIRTPRQDHDCMCFVFREMLWPVYSQILSERFLSHALCFVLCALRVASYQQLSDFPWQTSFNVLWYVLCQIVHRPALFSPCAVPSPFRLRWCRRYSSFHLRWCRIDSSLIHYRQLLMLILFSSMLLFCFTEIWSGQQGIISEQLLSYSHTLLVSRIGSTKYDDLQGKKMLMIVRSDKT